MTDEEAKVLTKQLTDAQLTFEVTRRKNMKHQQEVEKRKEEQRIYNLPENVAARKQAIENSRREALLRQYKNQDFNEYGVWSIFGENPIPDSGGSEPFLGKVEGTFEKAVEHALKLDRFFSWGAGGKLLKDKPEQITKL